MRSVALFAAALCTLLLPLSASAIQITGIEMYPDAPSASSGFIAVVRATSNASARVSWMSPEACMDLQDSCYGQFQRSGDAFVCYFSSADQNATCGPSPFLKSGSLYKFIVYGVDGSGPVVSQQKQVTTGAVPLNVFIQTATNGTNSSIKIQVFQLMDSVSYKIYDKSMIEKASGRLTRNEYGTFVGDIPYNENYRFMVFTGSGSSGTAGAAVTVQEPPAQQQPVELTYNVEAQEVKVYDILLTPGTSWKYRNCRVTNRGNASIQNLTVKVPDVLKRYLKATLDNSTLTPGASTMLALEISNLQGHLEISSSLPLLVGDKQVGEAEINVKISYLSDGTSSTSSRSQPTLSPSFIDEGYPLQEATKSITVMNSDTAVISITKATASPDLLVPTNVTLPETAIAPGASARVDVKFKPLGVGSYSGTITLETDAGNVIVPVKVTFYANFSERIAQLATALNDSLKSLSEAQKTKLATARKSVEDDLNSAADSYERGSYVSADASLNTADAKIAMLEEAAKALKSSTSAPIDNPSDGTTTIPSGSFDPTLIIIIAIVALGGFGAWYYFKKVRKAGWDGEVEEDF